MWFWYALLSALVSAVSVILNKKALKNINASLVSWALFAFSIPFLIYPAFKDGWPKINSLFLIATTASIILFAYAKTISLGSVKASLLSDIYPLTFLSVFFNYIFSLLILSESLRLIPIIGLLLIIIGGYFLKIEEVKEGWLRPFKLLFTNKASFIYIIAMVIMPLTSIFDKIGLQNIKPVNQSFLLLYENTFTTILLGVYMTQKDKNWIKELKVNFFSLSVNGFVYLGVSLLFLYGITTGAIALVSGIKKLEVIFVLLLSWLLFGDKPKKGVWIGCLIMLLGVVLIKLG